MNLLARFSPLVFALFVSGFSLGFAPVLADELPKDTNTIESLTPEQARKLAREFPGVGVRVEIGVYEYHEWGCLPLNGLKSLAQETAQALAGYAGGAVLLNGLTTLSPEAAKTLVAFKGKWLDLGGLTALDAATAKALAEFKGERLSLDGLATLDAATAKALAEFKGDHLSLDGLTALDADTAKALAAFKGKLLILNGPTTLDADTAKALAEFKGAELYLDGLTTLGAATAKPLAGFKGGDLQLRGLTKLDTDAAKALAGVNRRYLQLPALTTLDAATAKALAAVREWDGRLPKLTKLDAETAKALAEFKGYVLSLSGLTTLDADTAKALAAAEKWDGQLPGLTTLDVETAKALAAAHKWSGKLPKLTTIDSPDSIAVAQALATRQGPLSLRNLKKISPKTLMALVQKEDVEIPLVETLELIQEPDGSTKGDLVIPKWLTEREAEQRQATRNFGVTVIARRNFDSPINTIINRGFCVIRSEDELANLTDLARVEDAPAKLARVFGVEAIDWQKQMVVIVCGGPKRSGGYSVEITSIKANATSDGFTVSWKLNSPAGAVTANLTCPVQWMLVKRLEGHATFEPAAATGSGDCQDE